MSVEKKTTASFSAALAGSSPPRVTSGQGSATEATRRLTLDLAPDAHRAFRLKAAELDTTMKAMLVAFVQAIADGDPAAIAVAERVRDGR